MLASHADGLRGSSLIPNAWRNPKNVCEGGYIYVFEKKKKYRTSIIHGQILPQHFHYIHFTQLLNQRNLTTEKYHKKDGSRALKVDFQSRLIYYSLRKQKTLTHVHVNKIEAIHEVSRCVYVYSRSSMHCLCFIYARKIYLRTHVNWLDSVNPPYKGIREKEKTSLSSVSIPNLPTSFRIFHFFSVTCEAQASCSGLHLLTKNIKVTNINIVIAWSGRSWGRRNEMYFASHSTIRTPETG